MTISTIDNDVAYAGYDGTDGNHDDMSSNSGENYGGTDEVYGS